MNTKRKDYKEQFPLVHGVKICKIAEDELIKYRDKTVEDILFKTANENTDFWLQDLLDKSPALMEYFDSYIDDHGTLPKFHWDESKVFKLLRTLEEYYFQITINDNLHEIVYNAILTLIDELEDREVQEQVLEALNDYYDANYDTLYFCEVNSKSINDIFTIIMKSVKVNVDNYL